MAQPRHKPENKGLEFSEFSERKPGKTIAVEGLAEGGNRTPTPLREPDFESESYIANTAHSSQVRANTDFSTTHPLSFDARSALIVVFGGTTTAQTFDGINLAGAYVPEDYLDAHIIHSHLRQGVR